MSDDKYIANEPPLQCRRRDAAGKPNASFIMPSVVAIRKRHVQCSWPIYTVVYLTRDVRDLIHAAVSTASEVTTPRGIEIILKSAIGRPYTVAVRILELPDAAEA